MSEPATRVEHPWPKASAAWWAVTVFSLAAVLSYTDRLILSLLIDPIRTDLAITDTQVGVLQGLAFALIYSFAGLPLGRIADVFRRRVVIIAGVVVWSLATFACAYAQSFGSLFTARVFVGIGEACLAPAAMSMIGDYFPPQRRGTAIGVFLLGMVLGGGVAVMIGGGVLQAVQHGLVAHWPGLGHLPAWRSVLVLMALPGIVLVMLLLSVREPERRLHAGQETAGTLPLRAMLADFATLRGILVPLYIAMALMSVGDYGMSNWIPALLTRRFDMDAAAIGNQFGGAVMVGAALGVFGGGLMADRWVVGRGAHARYPVMVGAALLALPGALSGMAGHASLVMLGYAWWTLWSSAAATVALTALQDTIPNHTRGVANAVAAFGNMLFGLGGGSALVAWISDHVFGSPLAIGHAMTLVSVPACLLAVLSYWRAKRAACPREYLDDARLV